MSQAEHQRLTAILTPLLLVAALVVIRWQANVLLFHTLAELFSVVVGVLMLVIAWNTRQFTRNDFLVYLGIGFFWIAVLDSLHTFTVKGMPFFAITDAEITLHLWIYARLLEAFLLLSAVPLLTRKLNASWFLVVGAFITLVVSWASFALKEPVMLTEQGLTAFKIGVEVLVIALLLLAGAIYTYKRRHLAPRVYYFLLSSLGFTILAELSFTLYTDFQGIPFAVGHIFKFLSFWMIYQAIVQTTLREPFSMMAQASNSYDAIYNPTLVVDRRGLISQVNQAALLRSGKTSAQQLIHKPVHALFHPAELEQSACPLCQAIEQGESVPGEVIAFPAEQRWFLASLAPIQGRDEVGGMVHSLTEITERMRAEQAMRKSETHLRTLVEAVPDLIWLKDPEGVYLSCNRRFEAFFGAKEGEIIGQSDYDFVDADLADFFRKHDKAAMAAGHPTVNEEQVTFASDGHVELLETIKTPLVSKEGEVIGVLGVARDITEHKAAQRKLMEARDAAEAASKAKMAFLAMMSHEIRTPMNAILGVIDLLREDPPADERAGYLAVQERAGEGLLLIIDDILELSRLESGCEATRMAPFDLANLLHAVASLLEQTAREKGILLEVSIPDKMSRGWLGDERRIRQTMINLVGNAVKFTHEGYVRIIATPAARGGVRLRVEDTGIGIKNEHTSFIFDSFYQEDAYATRQHGGSGLGLTITKRLVDLMKGEIQLHSELHEGTWVEVFLPLEPAALPQGLLDAAAQDDQPQVTPKLNLLLAEDSHDNALLIKSFLKKTPHAVKVVNDGAKAVEALKQGAYDLVLMDMQMPVMDGYEATRHIREMALQREGQPIPIIALTAHAMEGDREKCLGAGCSDYLPKPIKKQKLLNLLHSYASVDASALL
uniref:histidine kinase n=1 Tax=Magnetococcus massalia (strain MO-1) TaxID=451514 RepID=A0A1S7LL13_MAGMO|nr:putative Histidine kinase. Containing two PAS 4 domains, HisKA, HATPase_c, Response_reg domains [Candidatus Magnetococcus massalia]